MNLTSAVATEPRGDQPALADRAPHPTTGNIPVRFTRTTLSLDGNGKQIEVFKMALDSESIVLTPLRSWGQLDVHKWVARGRLPNSPAGLEITPDHVRIAGETVSTKDPEGCAKLEKVFAEWLELERETLALARQKAVAKPVPAVKAEEPAAPQAPHYRVELGTGGQVHIRCVQGKETLAVIGLNVAGFKSLFTQGLMRKPHKMQTGALHDWVELDGQLFSFEKGNNDSAKLERTLNEHYLPPMSSGTGKDVVVFSNDASSTGFDIQFPAKVGGISDHHRRMLNEEALELLQDPQRCGLLHKGIVIKLTRPTLIFKRKTPDGGERYLESSPDNLVHTADEDGNPVMLDLSKPVNYTHLSTVELTAVFNHPTIHKHGKVTPPPGPQASGQDRPQEASPPVSLPAPAPAKVEPILTEPPAPSAPPEPSIVAKVAATPVAPPNAPNALPEKNQPEPSPTPPTEPMAEVSQPEEPPPAPNLWLADVLAQPVTRHDWFACLVYSSIARRLGNSFTAKLGLSNCWATALSETHDVSDPDFKGLFLTEKGGFGFLSGDRIARFNKGVAFVGTQVEAIEGIGVSLLAVGLDSAQRVWFLVTDDYLAKFSIPSQTVLREIALLKQQGARILSVSEALKESEPLEVVWTVPAQPGLSGEPEVVESVKTVPDDETAACAR